jgi:hypothetical protein
MKSLSRTCKALSGIFLVAGLCMLTACNPEYEPLDPARMDERQPPEQPQEQPVPPMQPGEI